MNKDSNKFSQYFELPNPGLRAYFSQVREGNSEEYRTPFAKGSSLSEVLSDWNTHLSKIADEWPSLVDFENDLGSKVGPLSIQKPLAERMDDIEAYYSGILLPQEPISDQALKAVLDEFKPIKGIRLRSQNETVAWMKKSTNSGSPYFTKRRKVVNKTIPAKIGSEVLYPSGFKYCAALGWRGQEGGPNEDDVKQRVVWMFPFGVNVLELQFYQPFISACQKHNLVPAWISMEAVDDRITRMFDTKSDEDVVICTDFSKFDQHFNETCQKAGSELISHILTDSHDWLNDVYPIKYNIPLAYDFGKIKYGKHGMGSGSGGTNADETLVHRALQHEAAINSGTSLNPNSQCLGDDGVLTYPGIKVEDVIRSYTAHGLEMNESKQYVSTQDCVYLRRWHHKDYRVNGVCAGVYSTNRALGRLCEQERFYDPEVWGPEMVALRFLSIIENVKYHPLREEFAEFCMERDKYRLGLDIPDFLHNIGMHARKAVDYIPYFLGYTKSLQLEGNSNTSVGIDNWWIVKYLKSKA